MPRDRRPSKQMRALLGALAARPRQWRYGYDIMKESGLLSGTLYPLLIRMTEQGLVEAEWHDPVKPGRPARHAYRLTTTGLAFAQSIEVDSSSPDAPGLPA